MAQQKSNDDDYRPDAVAAPFEQFRELLAQSDEDSLAEILTKRRIFQITSGRMRNCACLFHDLPLESTWRRLYVSIEKLA